MKKVNLIMAGLSSLGLLACGESESLVGKWTQPVPNMPQMEQGFVLEEGGKASSVNMATLSYEKWEKQNDRLILSGKSIGNRQTIAFSDTFAIEKFTKDSLVLKKGTLRLIYGREGGAENGASAKTVEGILTIGHEVRSLVIQGDTNDYWIADKTGDLFRQYDSITQGVKNGQPVYAKLQVVDAGHSEEGFAQNYDRVLRVVGIDSLAPYSRDLQLFREGIRTESVNGEKLSTYILFSKDSLSADLYKSGSKTKERLQRRTLPDGKHVWNIEDDDTKNLNFADGCWTLSQRGKILFKQSRSDNNRDLGTGLRSIIQGCFLQPIVRASDTSCMSATGSTAETDNSFCNSHIWKPTTARTQSIPIWANGTHYAASPMTTMPRYGSSHPTMGKAPSTSFTERTG